MSDREMADATIVINCNLHFETKNFKLLNISVILSTVANYLENTSKLT